VSFFPPPPHPPKKKLDSLQVESPGVKTHNKEAHISRKRHTEEQIISILKKADQGASTAEIRREHNISSATFYHWKAKFFKLLIDSFPAGFPFEFFGQYATLLKN